MTEDRELLNRGDIGRIALLTSASRHQEEALSARLQDMNTAPEDAREIQRKLRYGVCCFGIAREDYDAHGLHVVDAHGKRIRAGTQEYRTRGVARE